MDSHLNGSSSKVWNRLVKRSGEPVIRGAVNQAMAIMGNSQDHNTDVGPAIGQKAKENLEKHLANAEAYAWLIGRRELPNGCSTKYAVVPSAYGINSINDLGSRALSGENKER
jgi:RHH-type proline utilization regulon transcriptional repressor/proline dehydrogenase/delta 1-pyrroline-5-carboxylate dehydrogenase